MLRILLQAREPEVGSGKSVHCVDATLQISDCGNSR
jgi:hypothetical protein